MPGASTETLGKGSHSDDEVRELLKLQTALKAGYQVSIFAYRDGVHGFTAGQKTLAGLEDRRF